MRDSPVILAICESSCAWAMRFSCRPGRNLPAPGQGAPGAGKVRSRTENGNEMGGKKVAADRAAG